MRKAKAKGVFDFRVSIQIEHVNYAVLVRMGVGAVNLNRPLTLTRR